MRRYDVELFQRIEALTGQRMEQYAPPEDAVMLLLERTGEAQRIASMQVGHPFSHESDDYPITTQSSTA